MSEKIVNPSEVIKRKYPHDAFIIVETCRTCSYRKEAVVYEGKNKITYAYCGKHHFEFKLNEQYIYGWCPDYRK